MATLYIDLYKSVCGECDRAADPHEETHITTFSDKAGCGARYTTVSSHYVGLSKRLAEMRPDLELLSLDLPRREP